MSSSRFDRVLAIDLATKTGWAYRDRQLRDTRSSVVKFDKALNLGGFLSRYGNWLASHVKWLRPELVVYEQPHFRGANTLRLVSMAGLAHVVAHRAGLAVKDVHASAHQSASYGGRREYWLHEGLKHIEAIKAAGEPVRGLTPVKAAAILIARSRGYEVRDDNEADALLLLDYVCDLIGAGKFELEPPKRRPRRSIRASA